MSTGEARGGPVPVQIIVTVDVNEAADLDALGSRVLSLFAADPDDLFPEIETVDDCEIRTNE